MINVRLVLVLCFHETSLCPVTIEMTCKLFRKCHIKECFVLLHFLSLASVSGFPCEGPVVAELVTSIGMSYWSVGLTQNRVSQQHGTSHWWVTSTSPHPNWLLSTYRLTMTLRRCSVTAILPKYSKSRIETDIGSHNLWLLLFMLCSEIIWKCFLPNRFTHTVRRQWFTFVPNKITYL